MAQEVIASNPVLQNEVTERYGDETIRLMTVHCRKCGSWLGDPQKGVVTVLTPR